MDLVAELKGDLCIVTNALKLVKNKDKGQLDQDLVLHIPEAIKELDDANPDY